MADHSSSASDGSDPAASKNELTLLRKAIGASGEIMFLTDRDGLLTYVNPEFTRVYGWRADEVVGRTTPRVLKSGVISPEIYRDFWAALMRGEVVRGELANKTKSGAVVIIEGSANPVLDDQGEIIGFLAVQRDITERRQTEKELLLTRHSVDHAQDAIFWIGADGQLIYANDRAVECLGHDRTTLLTKSLTDIDPTIGDWPAYWNKLESHLSERHETEFVTARGSRVEVEVVASHMEFDGKKYGVVFARDITEQRRLSAQLQQAQKMEAVGQLAGGVAHDFNNILAVILGYASLVRDEIEPADPMRRDVEEIHGAAQRGARLTQQLLAFGRKQVLEPVVVEINECVSSMEKMLRRLIGENIVLEIGLSPTAGSILADPGQIQQVIMNLVVNARDAMPSGGTLEIQTTSKTMSPEDVEGRVDVKPGEYAIMTIRDTGCGIEPEVLPRVFEPFFTTKELGQGTGLGLSMVYGIVSQSKGAVEVESAVGQGTTFRLYFPLSREAPDRASSSRDAGTRMPSGSETILLVEDDDSVREIARRTLERRGYRVIGVANAGEALLVVEQHPDTIHLLLTDIVMPRLSGVELAARVKRERANIKVLLMTGYAAVPPLEKDPRGPSAPILRKPFTPEALVRRVRAILDR